MAKFGEVPQYAKDERPWADVVEIGPPPGEERRVGSIDAQIDMRSDLPGRVFRVFIELEDGDLEKLKDGKKIELGLWTHRMIPVSVNI